MNEWLISVGAGRWQLDGIRKAKDSGFSVLALDGDPMALGFQYADEKAVVDIRDVEKVLKAIQESGKVPTGAVALTSDVGMPAVGAIREKFNLPGAGSTVLHSLTNKAMQRKLWQDDGLPIPKWKIVKSLKEVESVTQFFSFPLVVKPVDSAGSRGVSIVEKFEELNDAIDFGFKASPSHCLILEEFLQGTEYTVESITIEWVTYVLAVTMKRKLPGTRGTVADQLATTESRIINEKLGTLASQALASLGYFEGPAHTEIMLDDDGKMGLVETSGRGGGFMVADGLVATVSGYDLNRATVLLSMGKMADKPGIHCAEDMACVLRFLPSSSGIVTGIQGFDEANMLPNIKAGAFVKPGFKAKTASQDSDRFGYILANGEDLNSAFEFADMAESMIQFGVKAC